MVFVSHIKPQHLMALTFISVHKDEDHPECCSSPMASFPSFRALCHLKRWTDNKAASSYSFFRISSLLRSCYSKFHTKFDCVTLLEAPLQEVASLFFLWTNQQLMGDMVSIMPDTFTPKNISWYQF